MGKTFLDKNRFTRLYKFQSTWNALHLNNASVSDMTLVSHANKLFCFLLILSRIYSYLTSVTMTFELQTGCMPTTHCLNKANICASNLRIPLFMVVKNIHGTTNLTATSSSLLEEVGSTKNKSVWHLSLQYKIKSEIPLLVDKVQYQWTRTATVEVQDAWS